MVKLRLLRWEVIFDDMGGPQMQSQMSSQDGDRESFDTWQRRKSCENGSGKLILKIGVMHPQAKECSSHQQVEEVRKNLPWSLGRECVFANTLILFQWCWFLTAGFQNCERIWFSWFKSSNLWQFYYSSFRKLIHMTSISCILQAGQWPRKPN